ncbi:MAG: phosphatidylethanolamine-binding protein [Candidatus Levybacteria bacterium RBG_16_35_6]|nr:MAG: phosphatidylethanolamine-binding protein [Candidatus Levybacteria bacterium RBG_16_35_6]
MEIKSSAFENNGEIPSKYACDGDEVNPPLTFSNVSENAKSLTLIVDDPDAPGGTFIHWVLFNIDPKTTEIKENSLPVDSIQGLNSGGRVNYVGPCPPSGTHRYFFKLYALDIALDLSDKVSREVLRTAMENHVIEKTELVGSYSRK